MKQVLIIQEFVPHYRVPFLEALCEALREADVDLRVAYGKQPGAMAYGSLGTNGSLRCGKKARSLRFFGGRLLLQPVLRRVLTADLVIVEQAHKHLINYLLLLL